MANLQVYMQQMSLSTVNFQVQGLGSQDEPLEKLSMQVAKTETLLQSRSPLQDTLRGLAKGTLANSVTTVYDSDTSNVTLKGKSADPQTVGTDSDVIEVCSTCYRRTCRPWCSCNCHKRHTIGSSGLMKQFIGSLFVGYSGVLLITEACNEKHCRRRSTFRVIANYQFPKWFWTRALFASVVSDVMAGPAMLLRVPRQVPFTSEAYQHCLNGGVTSLKLPFDAGKASPFDIDLDGAFLLNSALRYDKYQMCQYLVSKGADLYQEDQSGFSSYHVAWDMVLSEPKTTSRNNFIIDLFLQEGGLDERQFNRIHKIVLELIGTPLEADLGTSTAPIDEPDNLGRTPLFWAAIRGDDHRVRLLLEHGASPHIRATKGNAKAKTPLHAAARSGNHKCLSLLLQHGAPVEISDGEWLTPLFLAAGFNDRNKCVKVLLEHGAYINARAPEGHTPLMAATTNGMLNNSEVLLAHDPDIDIRDVEG
jgi:ankyrin repeat protein